MIIRKGIKVLLVVSTVVIGLIIGTKSVSNDTGLNIEQQVDILSRRSNDSDSVPDVENMDITSVYFRDKRDYIKSNSVRLGSSIGEVFELSKYVAEPSKKKPNDKHEYTMSDYITYNEKVEPNVVFYEYSKEGGFYLVGVNNTKSDVLVCDATILAIGTDVSTDLICHENLSIGVLRDDVHAEFESSTETDTANNCEVYYDELNNYVIIRFDEDVVKEFIVGVGSRYLKASDLIR